MITAFVLAVPRALALPLSSRTCQSGSTSHISHHHQLIIAMIFKYVSLQLEGEDLALVAATLRDKTPAAATRMAQQPKSRGLSDALLS